MIRKFCMDKKIEENYDVKNKEFIRFWAKDKDRIDSETSLEN
jgi:hypothetical protein